MKKILSIILVLCMMLSLVACGGGNNATNPPATQGGSATEGGNDKPTEGSNAGASQLAGTYDIKVWVAENIKSLTEEQIAKFNETNTMGIVINATVEAVGEGDAATAMTTDIEAGADLFCFAQDQTARLIQAGALQPLGNTATELVKNSHDKASVTAVTSGESLYGYPLTSDNGYFLYYDKSVIADPSTLEGIEEACKAAGKNFYMDIRSGWYDVAFFFGAGCMLTYDTDDAGKYTACNIDYASDKGVAALKAMINLKKSGVFVNGSSVDNATNAAAIVDGTWDSSAAKALFGDNYACAKLPTFTENGQTYQMGGFGGFKLLGVKPQTDEAKLEACDSLALYLSSEAVQLARYDLTGWGPSNLKAKASEKVQADAALTALGEQLAFCVVQGQYPGDYWSRAEALGDSIIAGEYDAADDAALLAVLQQFQDDCVSYAK